MAWLEPMTHASPPLGELTVIEPEGAVEGIVNVPGTGSRDTELDVLVMRIR